MSTESRYTVWHQRDDDGLVRAVFASPDELLFQHMIRHAHYLAGLANDGVTASIEDSDEGVVYVRYQNKSGEKGQDALVVGAPDQPFEEILMTQRDQITTAGVKENFGGWSSVPDQFMVDFETT
jgi:hypothetical protein